MYSYKLSKFKIILNIVLNMFYNVKCTNTKRKNSPFVYNYFPYMFIEHTN